VGILNTYRFITSHPLTAHGRLFALGRYLRWQLGSRLLGWPVVVPFVDHTRLLVRAGMKGATGNIYCGLHELEDMAFVLHFLRPEDLFVDVGANVGSYTVLASGVVGATTIAVEPSPAAFAVLEDNVRLNGITERVEAHNIAVGREEGTVAFTLGHDTGNHVVSLGQEAKEQETALVSQVPLGELLGGRTPALIKLDVEGYEAEVLSGAERLFADQALRAVLMELNGSGTRYGVDDRALHARMQRLGFMALLGLVWARCLPPLI
jgi:FkbM family methyltransferase